MTGPLLKPTEVCHARRLPFVAVCRGRRWAHPLDPARRSRRPAAVRTRGHRALDQRGTRGVATGRVERADAQSAEGGVVRLLRSSRRRRLLAPQQDRAPATLERPGAWHKGALTSLMQSQPNPAGDDLRLHTVLVRNSDAFGSARPRKAGR
jgi:hypothetical protein